MGMSADLRNRKILPSRVCKKCGVNYTPKPMGYNSLYCSKTCKERSKTKRRYDPDYRSGAYEKIKQDPRKHALWKAESRRRFHRIRKWIFDYKSQRGCTDCGYNKHPSALQFDHEGVKTESIAFIRTSIARVKKEIESGKCVIRCANCHSIRHWHQKNNLDYIPGKEKYENPTEEDKKQ
jgi:hypothetical protein